MMITQISQVRYLIFWNFKIKPFNAEYLILLSDIKSKQLLHCLDLHQDPKKLRRLSFIYWNNSSNSEH